MHLPVEVSSLIRIGPDYSTRRNVPLLLPPPGLL